MPLDAIPTETPYNLRLYPNQMLELIMAGERKRSRRNTLERKCLGKYYKRLFIGSNKSIFKMLETIKKV